MKIKCKQCGHVEKINKHFFVKALGVGGAGFGFWAWVSFLLAGTGLALPICVALVVGGAGVAAFSNEIVEWVSKKYPCPKCGAKKWESE